MWYDNKTNLNSSTSDRIKKLAFWMQKKEKNWQHVQVYWNISHISTCFHDWLTGDQYEVIKKRWQVFFYIQFVYIGIYINIIITQRFLSINLTLGDMFLCKLITNIIYFIQTYLELRVILFFFFKCTVHFHSPQ